MLTEQKECWDSGKLYRKYRVDESGKLQGECRYWYEDGSPWFHCFYLNGERHGEYIWWNDSGSIRLHFYYINGKVVHDFLENPSTEDEKVLLYLKYGAPMFGGNNAD